MHNNASDMWLYMLFFFFFVVHFWKILFFVYKKITRLYFLFHICIDIFEYRTKLHNFMVCKKNKRSSLQSYPSFECRDSCLKICWILKFRSYLKYYKIEKKASTQLLAFNHSSQSDYLRINIFMFLLVDPATCCCG